MLERLPAVNRVVCPVGAPTQRTGQPTVDVSTQESAATKAEEIPSRVPFTHTVGALCDRLDNMVSSRICGWPTSS